MYKLSKVSFSYGKVRVINKTDIELEPEKFYAFLGANGAGKSTLLKLLFGFLQSDEGKVYFLDKDILSWKRAELAQKIAYIPQEFHLQFDYKVKDIVMMGRFPYLKYLSNFTKKDKAIVEENLEILNLNCFKDKFYSHLSGGEKQRVSIARAFAQETKVLLLDEAFANLDINYHQEVMEILTKLNKTEKKMIIMVTHNINLASEYCDELIMLKNGEILAFGSPEKCLSENNLNNLYESKLQIITNPITGKPNMIYKGNR